MPQYDAVLAVNSESWDMQKSMTIMWDNLLPAMQADALSENAAEFAALKNDIKNLSLPVVKGLPSTIYSSSFNGKKVKVESNDYGVEEIQFRFSTEGCKLIIKKGKDETSIQCGWSKWSVNNETKDYPFPVQWRINVPSKIAGTATWTKPDTLQINLKFVEAIHGDKITCVFNDDKVSVSFLSSIAENVKNNPESRKELSGRM